MSTRSEGPPDFSAYQNILEYLYWDQDKTLSEVMKIMEDTYGFVAGPKRYKYYLTQIWGKRKNASEEESFAMLEIRRRRRIEENKDTQFTRLGRDVDNKNLDRFAKRHNWEGDNGSLLPEIRAATPPNIRYRTPDPETSTNSPQASHHASVPTQFTTNSVLGHPIPQAPQGFLQNDTRLASPRSTYQDHAKLSSHTSNLLLNGVFFWDYASNPPQPALPSPAFGMNPRVPAFPNDCWPRIDQAEGVIAAAPFCDRLRIPENIHGTELVPGVPGNTPLDSTAVDNDAHRPAGAMLLDGGDLGSSMTFPSTDDDTLEDVGDEMEWWLA